MKETEGIQECYKILPSSQVIEYLCKQSTGCTLFQKDCDSALEEKGVTFMAGVPESSSEYQWHFSPWTSPLFCL